MEIKEVASKHLGQSGSYAVQTDKFDSTLLVAMPRNLIREEWGIEKKFIGFDTWHCHESTFLTNNGLPIAGTLKIVYSSDSEFMVESKSIKLYTNSFDMCKMGITISEATNNYEQQIKKDLSELLKTDVQVHFFKNGFQFKGQDPTIGYDDLYDVVPTQILESLEITDYKAEEKHLKFNSILEIESRLYKLSTNVLRSRCRVTKQKDSGAAFILIKTKNANLDTVSLLKEIISLREVNEFHEGCSEKLFQEIINHPEVTDCCVMLLYSRRGSWDINPVRATSLSLIPEVLKNANTYTIKQMGQ